MQLHYLQPTYWTGPIFTKELRVSANRARTYHIRTIYLALLLVLVLVTWLNVVSVRYSYRPRDLARMAEAGKQIAVTITWFQFIAMQVMAIVLLSTALSEEIHKRSLITLLTTPLYNHQIVIGKLLSKLFQLLLLYTLSLPALALVRMFGGIPWDYLYSSFFVTMTTLLWLGCVTLYCSLRFKRAYVVMVITIIIHGLTTLLIPFTSLFFVNNLLPRRSFLSVAFQTLISHISPYACFTYLSSEFVSPGTFATTLLWPIHCIIMLVLTIPIVIVLCREIRPAALSTLNPQSTRRPEYTPPAVKEKTDIFYRPLFLHNFIHHFYGANMIWKEFLCPILGRFRFVVYGALIIFAALFFITLLLSLALQQIAWIGVMLFISLTLFLFLAILFTVTIPATAVTAEKEARTWIVLLTTCFSEREIILSKIIGSLRRIILAWSPFLFFFTLFAYTIQYAWTALIYLTIISLTAILFLTISGLYFSVRLPKSTPAVLANLCFLGFIWGILPLIIQYSLEPLSHHSGIASIQQALWYATPIGMGQGILEHARDPYAWTTQQGNPLEYWYIAFGLHASMMALFLWRTRANLRRLF